MFFGFFWGDWSIILLIPAMIFAFWAQIKVKSTFDKYDKIQTMRRMTGADAARRILDNNGLHDVKVEHTRGHLNDHYDPKAKVIRLSDATYGSVSVAALGVAAHEAGHAVQHATGYVPIKIRSAIIPITRFGSMLAMPLFFIGLLLTGYLSAEMDPIFGEYLMFGGILLFSFSTVFQLVTLPVEYNASARALEWLESSRLLQGQQLGYARESLRWAARTYLVAALSAIATVLYYVSLISRRND